MNNFSQYFKKIDTKFTFPIERTKEETLFLFGSNHIMFETKFIINESFNRYIIKENNGINTINDNIICEKDNIYNYYFDYRNDIMINNINIDVYNGKAQLNIIKKSSQYDQIKINVNLLKPYCEFELNSFILTKENDQNTFYVNVNHLHDNTKSNQYIKSISDGITNIISSVNINNSIKKCDSYQLIKNIIINNGICNSIPLLNITTNDVKAKHGSTTGTFNIDEIYYLKSRGLDEKSINILLKYAFINDILEKMPPFLKEKYEQHKETIPYIK